MEWTLVRDGLFFGFRGDGHRWSLRYNGHARGMHQWTVARGELIIGHLETKEREPEPLEQATKWSEQFPKPLPNGRVLTADGVKDLQ